MSVIRDLALYATPAKAKASAWFFKTGKGQYGQGDTFIGVTLPEQRIVARKYKDLPLPEIEKLLESPIHEHRLTGFIILVQAFKKADAAGRKKMYEFYLAHAKRANNWDLVDSSAQIVGGYLSDKKDRKILVKLARSKNLWERRIAIVATQELIRNDDFDMTLHIGAMLLSDAHDLIHKAVGWMLREVGKRDEKVEEMFLKKYYKSMPRTTLRYAIERFDSQKRKSYMDGSV
jgi:3-methyladenine DNA glycosylase AlkD